MPFLTRWQGAFRRPPLPGARAPGVTFRPAPSRWPHASSRDILGAAKTGSGKTLGPWRAAARSVPLAAAPNGAPRPACAAFLIPTLERLFRRSWTTSDGLGALILTPTRELALQIFEVLRRVGEGHSVSAGLVLGGKDFALEQSRITLMNVLVSTPGRLRQHLEQTPGFDTSGVEVLVLDEADRILDMGFEDDLNAILDTLPGPEQRQTLLFSATQTRKVRDLARLSLRRPEYLAVHEREDQATPDQLVRGRRGRAAVAGRARVTGRCRVQCCRTSDF